ncbi:MAG: S9 family peptidase [Proteobacteria bacterium]|nr:MAG: S9 family peptidase [Pseudomonadota bacterium]
MSLDQKTLDLLTAKDQQMEAQWLDESRILYLEASGRHWLLKEHRPHGQDDISLSPQLIGSSLAYSGHYLCVSQSGEIHLLGADSLIYAVTGEKPPITLPGPSSDLCLDSLSRLSWVGYDSDSGRDKIYLRSEGENREIHSRDEFIRHLEWNPKSEQALFLSWERNALPWHSAKLWTRTWVQISFDNREHSTPLRRSSRRTLGFQSDRVIISLSSEKAFWQIEAFDHHGHNQIIPSPMSHLQNLSINRLTGEILCLGSGLYFPQQIIRFDRKGSHWTSYADGDHLSSKLKAEPISWATDNGETVHGILYRDRSAKAPTPLLIPIHGGPTDAVQASWPSKAIAFVQQGYAVLYINYRGSWGFGYDYHQALEGHWGEREIMDCVSAVKSLAGSDWIDPNRVGLWGGGTASFTVLWALIKHPDVFHAGVAVFPILDLVHHFSLCSASERNELIWALGHSDPDFLREHSPLHGLARLERPLAIFAGGEDKLIDRQMLEKASLLLKEKKIPTWLSIYEDEGRAWRSHATYIDYYSKVAGFFDRFLRFRSTGQD